MPSEPLKEKEHIKPQLLPVPWDPGPGPSSASDTSTLAKTVSDLCVCCYGSVTVRPGKL